MLIVDDDHKEGRMMDACRTYRVPIDGHFPLGPVNNHAITAFSTSTELMLTLHEPIQQEILMWRCLVRRRIIV